MKQAFKNLLPILFMLLGAVMYPISNSLRALIPWVIGIMLFLTDLKVKPRDMKLLPQHFVFLAVQLALMSVAYALTYAFNQDYAEAILLCLLMPSATAGPAIVRLLSGDSGFTASYVLLTHFALILIAPFLFPLIHQSSEQIAFLSLTASIFMTIAPLIIVPMFSAWSLLYLKPKLSEKLAQNKQIPYFFWLFSVWLLMGKTTVFLLDSPSLNTQTFIIVGCLSALACALQFVFGQKLSLRLGIEPNAGRHAMGQKNTSLAIWLATLYLSPASALAAAAYILWQNFVITYRLAKKSA